MGVLERRLAELELFGSRLPQPFARAVNDMLLEGPGDVLRAEVLTAPDQALALTSRRLLLVREHAFHVDAEALALAEITDIRSEALESGRTVVVHSRTTGTSSDSVTNFDVQVVRGYPWRSIEGLVAMARQSPLLGLAVASPAEKEVRFGRARAGLVEVLGWVADRRKTTPFELERFSTIRELASLYGMRVYRRAHHAPAARDATTYLSGVPAFERLLQNLATGVGASSGPAKRAVRFDDVGRGLVIRIDFPMFGGPRERLDVGSAVHLRHDTVASAAIYENARSAVLSERTESSGGYVSARVFGRFRVGMGGMSGARSELIGSSVLTIAGSADGRAYELNFAVKSRGLDPVRYYFEKLYRDRFMFVEDGVGRGESKARRTSIATDLATLAELHRNGDLTDEEFQEAKSRLLS